MKIFTRAWHGLHTSLQ